MKRDDEYKMVSMTKSNQSIFFVFVLIFRIDYIDDIYYHFVCFV